MGRRKIEIKAIKDDRNRSVTFLKRKGGLFKKAHELSVLCSVDVAVFIFGNNKKLYEYSSSDMQDLIARYQYHGGPNEHKGPSDFNGGVDNQMMPPHFHGHQPPFPQIRHHTPSASPPIGNGAFQGHPGHPVQRAHTPQPSVGSRPGSRNDMRRPGPGMNPQPMGPTGAPHPGITYMPTPPIYNPPHQPGMVPQHGPQYSYPPQQSHMLHQPYMEERRSPMPPAYSSQPPSQGIQAPPRLQPSPQPNNQQLPPNAPPQISPPPPQPPQIERRLQDPQPPPPVKPKTEPQDRPQPPLLNTDTAIKKLPQRKTHSIFTPIEENRSILSQHLASFASDPIKTESVAAAAAANAASRAQSVDVGAMSRSKATTSPPLPQRASTQGKARTASASSIPETTFTPPSRSNSLKVSTGGGSSSGGGGGGGRARGPRLKVQIPDGGSEAGTPTGAESNSPRNPPESNTTTLPQRHNSQSSLVLPPPSPSASAILSAGATGPPNPFARPPPQQSVSRDVSRDTPVSALPSRFLNSEFLPSPSSFYQEWSFNRDDNNTLPSPLNFATPVVGSGPSFLREDAANNNNNSNNNNAATNNSNLSINTNSAATNKRKTPEIGATGQNEAPSPAIEPKRVKVE
ncbi:hypothetical protein G7046_g5655 [Stylonectria norvegica]|nr:hypothetical protein G7046_g5655 [Stylonectria norvegica]